jgi:hypothetical protein
MCFLAQGIDPDFQGGSLHDAFRCIDRDDAPRLASRDG